MGRNQFLVPLLAEGALRLNLEGQRPRCNASGTQRGSEKWRKANLVDLDDIYEPYPDDGYYEQRLGKR